MKDEGLTERIKIPDGSDPLSAIINFAASMVEIQSDDEAVMAAPSGWVMRQVFDYGQVGFYDTDSPALRGWWIVTAASSLDRYGQPIRATCRTERTGTGGIMRSIVHKKGPGMKILRANPIAKPPRLLMEQDAWRIEHAYGLLDANLKSAARTQILMCDKTQKDALMSLLVAQANGDFSIVDRSILNEIGSIDISTPFVGNDVHTLISNLWGDALRRWGGVTPPQYKAARTQSAEVAATVAETIDNIYIILDTLNGDAERLGVPVKFVYRGYGATFDQDPDENAKNTEQKPDEGVPTDA